MPALVASVGPTLSPPADAADLAIVMDEAGVSRQRAAFIYRAEYCTCG